MSAARLFLFVFVIIETLNMLELYFLKDDSVFNGVSIFSAWEKSRQYPEIHEFMVYLVNWLAGVKFLAVGLVLVIALTATQQVLVITSIVMIVGILTFYWRMYPTIRRFDIQGKLIPKGRSIILGLMVGGLVFGLFTSMLV